MMTDKDYAGVALELVKMSIDNALNFNLNLDDFKNGENEKVDLSSLYNYYHENITENNKQKVEHASIVKNKEKNSNNSEFLQRLRDKIVENAGDMEPRVVSTLLTMIDTEFRK